MCTPLPADWGPAARRCFRGGSCSVKRKLPRFVSQASLGSSCGRSNSKAYQRRSRRRRTCLQARGHRHGSRNEVPACSAMSAAARGGLQRAGCSPGHGMLDCCLGGEARAGGGAGGASSIASPAQAAHLQQLLHISGQLGVLQAAPRLQHRPGGRVQLHGSKCRRGHVRALPQAAGCSSSSQSGRLQPGRFASAAALPGQPWSKHTEAPH